MNDLKVKKRSSTSQVVQYKSDTSSVQYKLRTSSIQVRMCKQVNHQVLAQGGTTQEYFPMNELLPSLICQEKMASSLWQLAKEINYEIFNFITFIKKFTTVNILGYVFIKFW